MLSIKFHFFIAFAIFNLSISTAQKTIPAVNNQSLANGLGPNKTIVKLDPLTRLPIGNIPFDRTFILRVYFDPKANVGFRDEDVISIYLYDEKDKGNEYKKLDFYLIKSVSDVTKYDKSDDALAVYPSAIDIVVPALFPNRDYEIRYSRLSLEVRNHYLEVFKLFYENTENSIKGGKKLQNHYRGGNKDIPTDNFTLQYYNDYNLKHIYDKYSGDSSQANKDIVQFMISNSSLKVVIGGNNLIIQDFFTPFSDYSSLKEVSTYVYTVQSSAKFRVVADGGVIYTGWQPGFNSITPYVGINISLRPIDTDIPFRTLVKNERIKCYQRFTFNLGLTLISLSKDTYRANLFSNNNIMIGLGYKLSHVFNLNLGGLLYNNVDSNPLTAKKTLSIAPYTGLSINLLIRDALGDIAKVFSYAK